MTAEEFLHEIRAYATEELQVLPMDPRREWEANTVWLTVPGDAVAAERVSAALAEAGALLTARFAVASPPLTFYAWHDEQAGQLRLSVRSVAPDALPFCGAYQPDAGPDAVADSVAADALPGLVLWGDLQSESGEDPPEPAAFPVYVVALGASR